MPVHSSNGTCEERATDAKREPQRRQRPQQPEPVQAGCGQIARKASPSTPARQPAKHQPEQPANRIIADATQQEGKRQAEAQQDGQQADQSLDQHAVGGGADGHAGADAEPDAPGVAADRRRQYLVEERADIEGARDHARGRTWPRQARMARQRGMLTAGTATSTTTARAASQGSAALSDLAASRVKSTLRTRKPRSTADAPP